MKKLLIKDKNLRLKLKKTERNRFIYKSIHKNLNIWNLIRWNSFLQLDNESSSNSVVSTTNRCVIGISRKRFCNRTTFSRHIYLKLIRSGKISGIQKSNWKIYYAKFIGKLYNSVVS